MSLLINDLNFLFRHARERCAGAEPSFAYERLLKFIEANTPWCPPQRKGFDPWIEYKPGDPGPRVNDVIKWMSAAERETREWTDRVGVARFVDWSRVVAYSVAQDKEE